MTNFDQRYQQVTNQYNADSINVYSGTPRGLLDDAIVASAQQKLAELPLESIPEVATLPPGSRMPFSPNPHFVGRQANLRALATSLKGGETVLIRRVESTAATGMPGIGKTQLASEFVHRYGQYFAGGVYWLSFANANAVRTEIADCSDMIGLENYPDFARLSLDDKMRLVLSAWQSPMPRLLVFDNCEDEELFIRWRPSTGGCRVLITSLRPNWSSELGIKVLPLDCLSREESTALLCKHREDLSADDPDLASIADELGDLPLALHLAGRFLERYRYATIGLPGAYLSRLRQMTPLQHPSLRDEGTTSTTSHIRHVGRTFALAHEQLETQDDIDMQARKLLARAAYFAPNVPIPRDILQSTLGGNSTGDSSTIEQLAEDALERLIALGLLENMENGALRLHRLLAAFVKIQIEKTDTEAQTVVEQVVLQVATSHNAAGYSKLMFTLQPHLRFVTDQAKQRSDRIVAQLCNAQGYFLSEAGAYSEAKIYLERALAIYEQLPEEDPQGRVTLLNNLAGLYDAQGNYELAKQFAQQALEIGKRLLGPEHLLITDSLNILAKLCLNDGDYTKAESYTRRALRIRKQLLGPDHTDVAINLNNLAKIFQAQEQYAKAELHYRQALAIWKKEYGENHPTVAYCLNNLASLYRAQRKYMLAEQLYKDALNIRKQELGENHFDVAFSLNGLAVCYDDQGKHEDAEPLHEQARSILEQWLDITHPEIVSIFQCLANNYRAQGKYNQAEQPLVRILESRERAFGPEHPKVAQGLENLANNYYYQEKFEDAELCLKRALVIYERVRGPEHSDTIRIASLLRKIKEK